MLPLKARQHLHWLLAVALLLVFAAAFVFLNWSGGAEAHEGLVPESRRTALLGLAAMVAIFVLYAFVLHRRLQGFGEELRRAEVRERSLQARFDELGALFDASNEIAASLDLAGMLELAARRLRRGLEADACTVFLHGPASQRLRLAASGGDVGPEGTGALKPGEGVTGLVFGNGETMVVDAGPLLGQLAVEMNLRREPATAIVVPIHASGRSLGVVSVVRFDPETPYLQVHARMLEAFSISLAGTIVRSRESDRERPVELRRAA